MNGDIAGFLAVSNLEEAEDLVPGRTPAVNRLMRRCWPGDVDLVFREYDHELAAQLSAPSRQLATTEQGLRLSISASPLVSQVLEFVPGPLLFGWPARRDATGKRSCWSTAEELVADLQDRVSLLVDGGAIADHAPRTTIHITNDDCQLQPGGALSPEDIRHMRAIRVLFVCTGNTCRSPMAEGIFRKAMADRLQCAVEDLSESGVIASSAGLAAMPGAPASREAIDVNRPHGIDLGMHASQPLTSVMLAQADCVFTMTSGHRNAILRSHPHLADVIQLLSRRGQDVLDPMGFTQEAYEECRAEIAESVEVIADQISRIL